MIYQLLKCELLRLERRLSGTVDLAEDPDSVPGTLPWFTTAYNFSSRGSSALFSAAPSTMHTPYM